jgi:hypothetical protein
MPRAKRPRAELAISIKVTDLKTRDELIAADFLMGFCRPTVVGDAGDRHTGPLCREYFEPGSAIEREGRSALLRILRSTEPLSSGIRKYLADLFDHEGSGDRHAVLEPRDKRQQSDRSSDAHIANYFYRRKRTDPIKSAEDAAVHFRVSRKTIYKALDRHYEALERHKKLRKKKPPTVTPKPD